MFDNLPSILTAVVLIAAALGTAVAVYRTSLQTSTNNELRQSNKDLRAEIEDYRRREEALAAQLKLVEANATNAIERVRVLEDLLLRRKDDAQIAVDLAALKEAVDQNVLTMLHRIEKRLNEGVA